MTEGHSAGTLGELLASRRRGRFVGRVAEVELFRTALDSAEPPFSVLFLYGPGGIGKTTLLDAYAGLAEQSGALLVRLDGRDLVPSPAAVLTALAGVLEIPEGEGAIRALAGTGRVVLMIDGYERVAAVDDWLRTRLVPRLPATAVTVLAGRDPPDSAWRADPAWRDLLRVVSLRNLGPQESRRYLHESGVDAALHDRVLAMTHGHPFGLSLVADVVCRGGEVTVDPLSPDLVGALLRRFVDVVPSRLHRRAVEVCALARVSTEALLREVLELDDAHGLFAWLRGLSFVESGPEGVFPHDLARDALDADLRWRDPQAYRQTLRGVRAHVFGRLAAVEVRDQQRAIFDQKYMFRHQTDMKARLDWETWGQHYPEPARPQDRAAVLELAQAWEGPESAAIAEWWWHRQPEAFSVLRGADERVRGFVALVDLTAASAQDIGADPGAAAAWEFARAHSPPRPGEVVTQARFIVDRDTHQARSPTFNASSVLSLQHWLRTPRLAWYFVTLADPDQWNDYFAYIDIPRAVGADFTVGGRGYGLFAHDLRQLAAAAWLDLVTERALAREVAAGPPPLRAPAAVVLSQPDFEQAIRQALRDLHRPDLLARNPLLRTRLVRDRAASQEPISAVLHDLVAEAVATLRATARGDKLFHAVDRTYLRPAATQERAAAVLGLPFSTYRRHLSQGVAQVVAWLWDQEVYGPASSTEHS